MERGQETGVMSHSRILFFFFFSWKLEAHTLRQIKYSLTLLSLNVSSFPVSALSLVFVTL